MILKKQTKNKAMTADEVIKETLEKASEWIEISEDPGALLSRILANKIVQLNTHIQYLERRVGSNAPHCR